MVKMMFHRVKEIGFLICLCALFCLLIGGSTLGFFGFIAGAVAAAVGIYGDEMYDKHE